MVDVRGGGMQTPDGFRFELTGGSLCLDLANTIVSRPTDRRRELLRSYEDLVSWGEQAGAIPEEDAAPLLELAHQHPPSARRVLEDAHRFREATFTVFAAIARGDRLDDGALEAINTSLPPVLSRLRIRHDGDGFDWSWDSFPPELDRVLWPVIRSSATLLTSDGRDRVRCCASETCDWLFLDRSRNRSRRWCDMTICGNRDKVRRHYRRKRGVT